MLVTSAVITMNANDYVEICFFQNTGANLNIYVGAGFSARGTITRLT